MSETEVKEKGALRRGAAAASQGCSDDTFDDLVARGELKVFRIGRAIFCSMEELKRFIRDREAAGI